MEAAPYLQIKRSIVTTQQFRYGGTFVLLSDVFTVQSLVKLTIQ